MKSATCRSGTVRRSKTPVEKHTIERGDEKPGISSIQAAPGAAPITGSPQTSRVFGEKISKSFKVYVNIAGDICSGLPSTWRLCCRHPMKPGHVPAIWGTSELRKGSFWRTWTSKWVLVVLRLVQRHHPNLDVATDASHAPDLSSGLISTADSC